LREYAPDEDESEPKADYMLFAAHGIFAGRERNQAAMQQLRTCLQASDGLVGRGEP